MTATERIAAARKKLNAILDVLASEPDAAAAWRAIATPISNYTAEVIAAIKEDTTPNFVDRTVKETRE